jgi:hypothetical protein
VSSGGSVAPGPVVVPVVLAIRCFLLLNGSIARLSQRVARMRARRLAPRHFDIASVFLWISMRVLQKAVRTHKSSLIGAGLLGIATKFRFAAK